MLVASLAADVGASDSAYDEIIQKLDGITNRLDELTASQINITSALDALQKQVVRVALCPAGWKRIGNSCYVFSSQKANQTDAQRACGRLAPGAHLASVHADSLQAVKALMVSSGRYWFWLGLQRVSDGWQWSDGSETDVLDWAPGKPDNKGGDQDCVFWASGSGQWDDYRCSNSHYYLCQLDLAQ